MPNVTLSEKRKVGGSPPPLTTTSSRRVCSADLRILPLPGIGPRSSDCPWLTVSRRHSPLTGARRVHDALLAKIVRRAPDMPNRRSSAVTLACELPVVAAALRAIGHAAGTRHGTVSLTAGGTMRLCRSPRKALLRLASSRRCCGTATGFCSVTDLPGAVGIPTSGTCPVGTWSPGKCLARHLLENFERSWASTSRRPSGPPVQEVRGDTFDMQIWLIEAWTGSPVNAAPDEHDAIAWFTEDALGELSLAHDSYLAMFRWGDRSTCATVHEVESS